MISPKLFEELVMYELETQSQWLDYALYHLDGEQQVKHLDRILSVKGINAVQWTNVAGQPGGNTNDYGKPVLQGAVFVNLDQYAGGSGRSGKAYNKNDPCLIFDCCKYSCRRSHAAKAAFVILQQYDFTLKSYFDVALI